MKLVGTEGQIEMSSRCQIEISPGWWNRIFRGCLGDVEGRCPRDVLETNICLLDCALKNDMRNLADLTQHLKVSKVFTLMRSFRPKYIMFEGKMTYGFINDMRNLVNFIGAFKYVKICTLRDFFDQDICLS